MQEHGAASHLRQPLIFSASAREPAILYYSIFPLGEHPFALDIVRKEEKPRIHADLNKRGDKGGGVVEEGVE